MRRDHTILLMQPTTNIESRSWSDYESMNDCLEGICKAFEEFLKKKSPGRSSITYDIVQLFDFIDNLTDLSMLVQCQATFVYAPHDKKYIKERIFEMMKRRAQNEISNTTLQRMMISPGHEETFSRQTTIGSIPEDRIYEQAIDEEDGKENGDPSEEPDNGPFKMVNIEKTSAGFGFHIVGGIDCPHLKNDIGIFISTVNPQSKSFGVVQTGDKILSFDGIDMTCKNHDDAVDVFRKVEVGHVARVLIDRSYELTEDPTQTPSVTTNTPSRENFAKRNSSTTESVRGRLTPHGVNTVVEKLRGTTMGRAMTSYDEDDAQSVTSYAPSTHSIIDDVPRTPRKPMSLLDPRNNSWFTEALYVSIGLGALTLSGLVVYRILRGGRH
ncbi:unnamed protein product [Caenorhabditis angaria]|uniref:PDZ domain-containing protein n=1 Tax=Caenorhabditis angaria TaxID=860376 RepID=A0A9P1IY31_9PELO|nr:unnamed protein product [Caenorhabditis angaria]